MDNMLMMNDDKTDLFVFARVMLMLSKDVLNYTGYPVSWVSIIRYYVQYTYKAMRNMMPSYLTCLVNTSKRVWTTRSNTKILIPKITLKRYSEHTFKMGAATLWISITNEHLKKSKDIAKIKTYLFNGYYWLLFWDYQLVLYLLYFTYYLYVTYFHLTISSMIIRYTNPNYIYIYIGSLFWDKRCTLHG